MAFLPIYVFESYPPSHSNSNAAFWADHSSPNCFPSLLNTSHIYMDLVTRNLLYKSTLMYMKYKLYMVKYSIQMLFTVIQSIAVVFVLPNLSLGILFMCCFMESLTTWVQTPQEQDPGHKYLYDSSPSQLTVSCPECSSVSDFVKWVDEWWMSTLV